jgi:hypothetical protein
LVNGIAVSIHQAARMTLFWFVAFIFDKRRRRMVNRAFPARRDRTIARFRVNPALKDIR